MSVTAKMESVEIKVNEMTTSLVALQTEFKDFKENNSTAQKEINSGINEIKTYLLGKDGNNGLINKVTTLWGKVFYLDKWHWILVTGVAVSLIGFAITLLFKKR